MPSHDWLQALRDVRQAAIQNTVTTNTAQAYQQSQMLTLEQALERHQAVGRFQGVRFMGDSPCRKEPSRPMEQLYNKILALAAK